jgi:hypothetical protein
MTNVARRRVDTFARLLRSGAIDQANSMPAEGSALSTAPPG